MMKNNQNIKKTRRKTEKLKDWKIKTIVEKRHRGQSRKMELCQDGKKKPEICQQVMRWGICTEEKKSNKNQTEIYPRNAQARKHNKDRGLTPLSRTPQVDDWEDSMLKKEVSQIEVHYVSYFRVLIRNPKIRILVPIQQPPLKMSCFLPPAPSYRKPFSGNPILSAWKTFDIWRPLLGKMPCLPRNQDRGSKTSGRNTEQHGSEAVQEPLNAPFLNGLFSSGFSRGKTAPWDEIGETPH